MEQTTEQIVIENQKAILANQQQILENQKILREILSNQEKIIAQLSR